MKPSGTMLPFCKRLLVSYISRIHFSLDLGVYLVLIFQYYLMLHMISTCKVLDDFAGFQIMCDFVVMILSGSFLLFLFLHLLKHCFIYFNLNVPL